MVSFGVEELLSLGTKRREGMYVPPRKHMGDDRTPMHVFFLVETVTLTPAFIALMLRMLSWHFLTSHEFSRRNSITPHLSLSTCLMLSSEFLALLEYLNRAHKIEIRPSSVCGIDYL